MILFVPKEADETETRTAMTPESAKKLVEMGLQVTVENGLGVLAGFCDEDYVEAGAQLTNDARTTSESADIVARLSKPSSESLGSLGKGTFHLSFLDPFNEEELIRGFAEAGVSAVSLEMIPRTTLAQKMDVLSSQANLAGYQSVVLAAERFNRILPMMMTPAGTLSPAKVFIIGVGVAGLQAIATAKRLGAVVYASDVRKSAAEQIESVGGRFIEVDGMDDFEDEAGYAKPLTPEFIQKVNDTVCGVASDADIIVTTARIFGRPAPITVPSSAVKDFKSGAVVVDMNADVGGNCEDTVAGEVITTENGVIVVGTSNLPGTIATTASMLYSNNLTTFITSLVNEGAIVISEEDDILVGAPEGSDFYVNGMGGVLICQHGEMHPKQTRLGGALE